MRLTPKIQSKYLLVCLACLFLLILPLRQPVKNLFTLFSRQIIVSPQRDSQKLKTLEKEKLNIILQLRQFQALKEENEQLRQALNFTQQYPLSLIGAEIIAFDPSHWRRVATVNAGEDKAIKAGSYVIDAQGWLMGRIEQVSARQASIVFVDDPDFNLGVFIGEESAGLLAGGLTTAKILYVEKEEAVKPGDKVWCRIPSLNVPIDIGEVKRITHDKNTLFWDIEVKIFSRVPIPRRVFIVN